MKGNSMQKKTLTLGAASLVLGAIAGISTANADNGNFSVLGSGEQIRANIITSAPSMMLAEAGATGSTGVSGKTGEGKCGEGKCGDKKKSGEGKCGDKKKAGEGKCGEHKKTGE